MVRVLLIVCGQRPANVLQRFGDFDCLIRGIDGGVGVTYDSVRVFEGQALPPSPEGYSAIIISGSASMLTEALPWMATTMDWVRRAVQAPFLTPCFGICFGHQLLASALGGQVAPNPNGKESGPCNVSKREATSAATTTTRQHHGSGHFPAHAVEDPIIGHVAPEGPFAVYQCHMQSITQRPAGAISLLANAHDENQMLRYDGVHGNDLLYSVQFHPEYSNEVAKFHLAVENDVISPLGPALVARFLELSIRRSPYNAPRSTRSSCADLTMLSVGEPNAVEVDSR